MIVVWMTVIMRVIVKLIDTLLRTEVKSLPSVFACGNRRIWVNQHAADGISYHDSNLSEHTRFIIGGIQFFLEYSSLAMVCTAKWLVCGVFVKVARGFVEFISSLSVLIKPNLLIKPRL